MNEELKQLLSEEHDAFLEYVHSRFIYVCSQDISFEYKMSLLGVLFILAKFGSNKFDDHA